MTDRQIEAFIDTTAHDALANMHGLNEFVEQCRGVGPFDEAACFVEGEPEHDTWLRMMAKVNRLCSWLADALKGQQSGPAPTDDPKVIEWLSGVVRVFSSSEQLHAA